MAASAVDSLVDSLLEMAEAKTNPVLEIINPDKPLEENKKYPAGLLQFNQSGWRAYYHCHPASRAGNHRFKGEHGHFHIFVRTQHEPETWSHLVALAMDPMGQPLGWFTVNHWVTGESWENAHALGDCLKLIPYDSQVSIVEKWLLAFLNISHDTVKTLLYKRDDIIENKIKESGDVDIKQDKSVYILSEAAISLENMLDLEIH